jgi:hypothetical protein
MGFEWEYCTWYVTSVLDSVYHKNRDEVKGGFEGYPHPVPRPHPAAHGPRPMSSDHTLHEILDFQPLSSDILYSGM